MNNLTTTVMANHSHIKVQEWHKQGNALEFNSGKNQRIISTSIPAIEMTVTYKGLNKTKFDALVSAYESNHANTVIIDTDDIHDLRDTTIGLNASVWVFKEFRFTVIAPQIYSGTLKLVTSVFFDYTEYQSAFSQSSSYTPVTSTDTSFTTVLSSAQPHKVEYGYISNSIFSSIGSSARHIKDKAALRKKWKLSWLLSETDFLVLLTFYRKKAGIMGSFGMPVEGANSLGSGGKHKAYFFQDSFKYDKRLDGIYICNADIVELMS